MSVEKKVSGKFQIQVVEVKHIQNPQAQEKTERDYWAYVVKINRTNVNDGPIFSQEKTRRFNDFREFDMGWRQIYPTLHEKHQLPESGIQLKSKEAIARERKPQLDTYLRNLGKIPIMWPSFSEFLAVPLETLDPNFKKVNIKPIDMTTSGKGGRHGNDTGASIRAAKDREEFLRKNEAAIQNILAGQNFALPKKRANWSQRIQNRKHYWDSKRNLDIGVGDGAEYTQGEDNLYVVNIAWEPDDDEPNCIPIILGEVLDILQKVNEDWWWGNNKDGLEGYFPAACLTHQMVKVPKGNSLSSRPPVSHPSKCEGMEEKLNIPLDDFKEMITKGDTFTKYAQGMGMPTSKDLFWRKFTDTNTNIGCVFYTEVGGRDQSSKRMIPLRLITDFYLGKQTAAFRRKVAKKSELSRTFSIKTSDGNDYNFEAKDRETRSNWCWGLFEIMASEGFSAVFHHEQDLSEADGGGEMASLTPGKTKSGMRSVSSKFSTALTSGLDTVYQAQHKPQNLNDKF